MDGVKVLVGKVDQMMDKIRLLIGVEEVLGTLDQVMPIETRIQVGRKKVIGMEEGVRILIGAKEVIGTLDLVMQTRILVGEPKAIGTLEMPLVAINQ